MCPYATTISRFYCTVKTEIERRGWKCKEKGDFSMETDFEDLPPPAKVAKKDF